MFVIMLVKSILSSHGNIHKQLIHKPYLSPLVDEGDRYYFQNVVEFRHNILKIPYVKAIVAGFMKKLQKPKLLNPSITSIVFSTG